MRINEFYKQGKTMNIKIQTERLTLRPICLKDLQTTHEYAACTEITQYMLFLPNKTIEETKEFLQYAEGEWSKESPQTFEFAICLNGQHIGAISLMLGDKNDGELGWILNKKYHRNGYCTEAAQAMVQLAKSLGLVKLKATCDTRNVASRRVMEKIGMTFVCEVARRYFDERGEAREYQLAMEI